MENNIKFCIVIIKETNNLRQRKILILPPVLIIRNN